MLCFKALPSSCTFYHQLHAGEGQDGVIAVWNRRFPTSWTLHQYVSVLMAFCLHHSWIHILVSCPLVNLLICGMVLSTCFPNVVFQTFCVNSLEWVSHLYLITLMHQWRPTNPTFCALDTQLELPSSMWSWQEEVTRLMFHLEMKGRPAPLTNCSRCIGFATLCTNLPNQQQAVFSFPEHIHEMPISCKKRSKVVELISKLQAMS